MKKGSINGIAVHAMDEGEYCWVYLSSIGDSSRYAELPGDDDCYPSHESALVAAYLALRRHWRKSQT